MKKTRSTEIALAHNGFLRVKQIIELINIGKSTWWAGVKVGRFPAPIRLGSRMTLWRASDIADLIDGINQCQLEPSDQQRPRPRRLPCNRSRKSGAITAGK